MINSKNKILEKYKLNENKKSIKYYHYKVGSISFSNTLPLSPPLYENNHKNITNVIRLSNILQKISGEELEAKYFNYILLINPE